MFSLTGKSLMDPYTKAAAVWGRAACPLVSTSCRAPYAGVSRVRFQGTLSTLSSGVPLAVTRNISGQVSTVNSAAPPLAPTAPYCVVKMNV